MPDWKNMSGMRGLVDLIDDEDLFTISSRCHSMCLEGICHKFLVALFHSSESSAKIILCYVLCSLDFSKHAQTRACMHACALLGLRGREGIVSCGWE